MSTTTPTSAPAAPVVPSGGPLTYIQDIISGVISQLKSKSIWIVGAAALATSPGFLISLPLNSIQSPLVTRTSSLWHVGLFMIVYAILNVILVKNAASYYRRR